MSTPIDRFAPESFEDFKDRTWAKHRDDDNEDDFRSELGEDDDSREGIFDVPANDE